MAGINKAAITLVADCYFSQYSQYVQHPHSIQRTIGFQILTNGQALFLINVTERDPLKLVACLSAFLDRQFVVVLACEGRKDLLQRCTSMLVGVVHAE